MQPSHLVSYVASARQADIARHVRDAERNRIPEPARKPARERYRRVVDVSGQPAAC
jgi:hypothetical protein